MTAQSQLRKSEYNGILNIMEQAQTSKPSVTPSSKDFIVAHGVVDELLPGAKFKITLENGQQIIGHLGGKMRMFRIRILPGDRVKLEISPYDLTKGRIVYRG